MTKPKPFYEFVGREPHPPLTDRLIWQNRADPTDRISASEWWFWRLWRYHLGKPQPEMPLGEAYRGRTT
jgi:hypothetical protein